MLDFAAIRKLYKSINPQDYNPYPIDWIPLFTPIESRAWDAIRYIGLPMWPQYQIGKYFADFADPIKKIVIECDGKAFHSPGSDDERDRWMNAQGWTVFRISGADCNRMIDPPWEQVDRGLIDKKSDEYHKVLADWSLRTVDGLVSSIWRVYYCETEPEDFALAVVRARKSIPKVIAS